MKQKRTRIRHNDDKNYKETQSQGRPCTPKDDLYGKGRTNDPAWYSPNSAVLRDAASFSFNSPLGSKFTLNNSHTSVTLDSGDAETVPGIMNFGVVPGIGLSTTAQSGANICAKSVYSFVRHMNSGHANYDSPDLMMYLLAVDSAYYMYSWAKRTYKAMFAISERNRFLPQHLVKAMGWDYDDLKVNLANFRGYLNQCVTRMKAFCIPKTMPLHKRHAWMFSGVWSDSEDIAKSQLYLFYPQGFYTYDETSGAGQLVWHWMFDPAGNITNPAYYMTYAKFVTAFESILAPLIGSEDIGIMSGDIKKAYGDGNLYELAECNPTDTLEIVHDEMVLRQIQNMVINKTSTAQASNMNITQDVTVGSPTEGCILYNPITATISAYSASYGVFTLNKLLNAGTPAPDPIYVAEITRLSNIQDWVAVSGGTGYQSEFLNLGSEFVCVGHIFWINATTGALVGAVVSSTRDFFGTFSAAEAFIVNALYSTAFDFHPEFIVYIPGTVSYLRKAWDYENYTVITPEKLEDINKAVMFSLFGLPM